MSESTGRSEERTPTVSLVVVAYEAAAHLPHLLRSVADLDYPPDRMETIVVDNASTDGTAAVLRDEFPDVRVLAQSENLGFAEGNNVGARASEAECVAFVNADMRLDRAWLRELVAMYAPADGTVAASSLILDWEGERVDFAGATLNFHGHGNQVGHGVPVGVVAIEDGAELLFACGGAMLVGRGAFLDAGGFDPSYFIYFEDVDLGWRLRLLGHRIRLAGRARAYHRGHATTSAFREAQTRVLYERNALRTLIKNLDDANLDHVLAASLLLLVERARLATGSPRAEFQPGAEASRELTPVHRLGLAPLHAVGDVVAGLDPLFAQRARIQARRRVSDEEIFALFGRPLQPAARDDSPYLQSFHRVVQAFGLAELFRPPAVRVVVARGGRRAGRLDELAAALEPLGDVRRADGDLSAEARGADLVVADAETMALAESVEDVGAVRALDVAGAPPAARADGLLAAADALLCGTAEERDRWVAALEREGRLGAPGLASDVVVVADDEGLRRLTGEPWRWERLRARRSGGHHAPPPDPTGVADRAIAQARRAGRPVRRRLARLRAARRRGERFVCNVCGAESAVTPATFDREQPSCPTCGSTARWRSVVHVLSTELFGTSIPLPDFPDDRSTAGVGLTDWEGYAAPLAEKLGYVNTFLHQEPRLDLTQLDARWEGRFDFVLCSEVLEHVRPPLQTALENLRGLLTPTGLGFAVITVPYAVSGPTVEYFPDLHDFAVVEQDGRRVLRNVARDGTVQVFEDVEFHGGDGETLEMRAVSEPALRAALVDAGFAETETYGAARRFGIDWPGPWSWPIVARAVPRASAARR